MGTKTYTIAEAQKDLLKLIREAERGDDVCVTLAGEAIVKVVPVATVKERKPGGFEGKISWTADAFDPLSDEELNDLGFE